MPCIRPCFYMRKMDVMNSMVMEGTSFLSLLFFLFFFYRRKMDVMEGSSLHRRSISEKADL